MKTSKRNNLKSSKRNNLKSNLFCKRIKMFESRQPQLFLVWTIPLFCSQTWKNSWNLVISSYNTRHVRKISTAFFVNDYLNHSAIDTMRKHKREFTWNLLISFLLALRVNIKTKLYCILLMIVWTIQLTNTTQHKRNTAWNQITSFPDTFQRINWHLDPETN